MPAKISWGWARVLLVGAAIIGCGAYALVPAGPPPAERPDRILVLKSRHEMSLLKDGRVLKTYAVSLGRSPSGQKTRTGDHKTPEGVYLVDWRNPHSKFHLSLHISYPEPRDSARAHKEGVEPGGDIMIHGLPNRLWWIGRFHRFADWTDGCIAVTDPEIDQLWRSVPDRTPIEIRP
jgi:murein L,D-transpeptidase YafK